MNDMLPTFVYSADVIKQAELAVSWVETDYRRERRGRIGWMVWAASSTTLLVMALIALDAAVPAIRLVPITFWQRADGVVEHAITTDSLPVDLADAQIQAWLWQYIQWRESYSWAEFADYSDQVLAMSSDDVADAYRKWADAKNKESYAAVYNTTGVVRIKMGEVIKYERAFASKPGEYAVHVIRSAVVMGDPRVDVQTWTITLKFLQDYKRSAFRVNDIRTFNPSRILVTSYPGPQPMPKPQIQGGEQP